MKFQIIIDYIFLSSSYVERSEITSRDLSPLFYFNCAVVKFILFLDAIPSIVTEFQTRRHMAGNLVSHNNGATANSEKPHLPSSTSPQLRCDLPPIYNEML